MVSSCTSPCAFRVCVYVTKNMRDGKVENEIAIGIEAGVSIVVAGRGRTRMPDYAVEQRGRGEGDSQSGDARGRSVGLWSWRASTRGGER